MTGSVHKPGWLARLAATRSGRMQLSAVLTLLLVGLSAALLPITFLTNDDASIMYTFAGYYTGEPYPVHGFVNLPLGYVTSLLYMVLPQVPWWPVLQLVSVSISIWVIFYTLWDVGADGGRPAWTMLLINVFLYAMVLVYAVAKLSFTLTACMLGTAGVLRILSVDSGGDAPREMTIYAMLESLALMIFCFLFRNSTGYSMACFWAAAVVYQALNGVVCRKGSERKRVLLRLGTFAVFCIAVFGALVWLNNWSYRQMNPADYAAFEDARGRYLDFPHVTYDEDPAFFESLGWDREIYNLVENSCYIDPHVTAQSLNAILAYDSGDTSSLAERFLAAMRYGEAFFRGSGPAEYLLVAPVLLALWSVLCFFRNRKRAVELLLVLGLALGSFGLCFYLCLVQRLILRAFQVIGIPAAAMMLLLCLRIRTENPPPKKHGKTVLRIALILLTLFSVGWSVTKSAIWLRQYDPQQRMADMRTTERYAMEHEKNVYIFMPTFIFNNEAFKTYPGQKPTNMMDWGDTGMYSGWKMRQLEKNGIEAFVPEIFKKDNVYLMGTLEGGELQVLIDYLVKDAGAKGMVRVDTIGTGYAVFKVVY